MTEICMDEKITKMSELMEIKEYLNTLNVKLKCDCVILNYQLLSVE